MAKLEYTPIQDFQRFNFLGKRLFDFVNLKLNATTGKYVGNGIVGKTIQVDIIPKCIIIFSVATNAIPVIWIDAFDPPLSMDLDGMNLTDAILGLSGKKDKFIVGSNTLVNNNNFNYAYIVFGN